MAWLSKCTLIINIFMVAWIYVQGANKGFMVSTYAIYDGRIKAYQGDVESITNTGSALSRQLPLKYNYITSLTADPHNESIYFLDVQFHSIYKLDNVNIWFNNSQILVTRLHKGISIAIGSIVFDWISRNIYWTDRYHNWISMMPVTTRDPLMIRAVVEESISVPVALAVDPKAGLLFWSDTQPSARIEWSNLLGENRTVMLSGNMQFIIALAVDPDGQRIYFTDYIRSTLEVAEYGGHNRTVLTRLNTYKFVDIAFYKGYLCTVDQRYRRTLCYSTSGDQVFRDDTYSNPWGICVFDKSTQSQNFIDYCSNMNCSHFCVNMPTEARCVCKEGYDLQDDNTTCISKHGISGKGLVYTNGTSLCILHITAITGADIKPDCVVDNLDSGTTFLQADSNNGKIHFWNETGKMLKTYDLLSKTSRLITYTGNSVSGLFYDWIADDLYWSEADIGYIKVAALRESTVQVTDVFTGLSKPRFLTSNPHKYVHYWISGNDGTSSVAILSGTFNDTYIATVFSSSKGLDSPIALIYDEVRNRLYWVDKDQVRSVQTDGTGVEQHIKVTGANALLKYKDYLIWRIGVHEIRASFTNTTNAPIRIKAHGNITGLCVFDSRIQRMERGPCEDENGQCEHICLPTETGPVCRCNLGSRIAPDEKTCRSDLLMNNFALLVDNTHNMIYQLPTDLQTVTENDFVALNIPVMHSPTGVLYDNSTGNMYWSELQSQLIRKIKLGSNYTEIVIQLDKWYPDRMVMDESTGYLYYTAIRRYDTYGSISYIGVFRFDLNPQKPKNKQLVKGLDEPRGLAIHPKKGFLFWSEIKTTGSYIGKTDMDGQNHTELVTGTRVNIPIGLSIDYTTDYLYWVDMLQNQIKRVTLDGGNYEIFYTDRSNTHPSDVFVQGAYIYYISWNKRKITKLNKTSATKVNWMKDIPDLGRLDNLQIFPGDKQPTNDVCRINNGGCSVFCLPKPNNSKVCACEESVNLRSDKRTCTNVCKSIIPNGKIEHDCAIYPGSICGYTCNTYYKKKNPTKNKITCLNNMSWNETNLCEAIMCDLSLISITNGKVKSDCIGQAGIACDYTCNKGYQKISTNTTFMCNASAKWDTSFTGLCKEITCDLNTINVQNGKVDSGCFGNVDSKCNYECNSGYRKNANLSTFMCTSTGDWNTNFKDLCTPIRCNLTSINIKNGKANSGCTGNITDPCGFTCESGYKRNESFTTFQCTSKGEWDTDFKEFCQLITCDVSSVNIEDGTILNECTGIVGTTCDYTCSNGYKKSELHPIFSCLKGGVWNTNFSDFCTLITCDLNSINIRNGKVMDGCNGTVGQSCNYICDNNYKQKSSVPVLKCLSSGMWNTDFKDICQLITCDTNNVIIANGKVKAGCTGNVDETCDYTCDNGYKKKNQKFQCTSSGQWNTDFKDFCKLITCDTDNVIIANGTVKAGCTGNVDETCDYTCDNGFKKNYQQFQCTSSGQWNTDFRDFCKPIICDTSAINIKNGGIKDGCTGAIGGICHYECDKGYLKGSESSTFSCNANGIWNTDFMGFCKPIRCALNMPFQHGVLSVNCKGIVKEACNFTCNKGYRGNVTNVLCLPNGTWSTSLNTICKEILDTSQPINPQASKAGLIGGTIGGVLVILVAVAIVIVVCLIRIRRRKSQQQGVYKDNPNVSFPNEDLRNNPYSVFDNPSEPERSNDGSIQFSDPFTGIELPSSNVYSESSIQPTFSIEGATGRGVQFSNPLCFVDDVYVSVPDKKTLLSDDECDDPQTFHLKDISEETLTFSPSEKDEGFENVQSENA